MGAESVSENRLCG